MAAEVLEGRAGLGAPGADDAVVPGGREGFVVGGKGEGAEVFLGVGDSLLRGDDGGIGGLLGRFGLGDGGLGGGDFFLGFFGRFVGELLLLFGVGVFLHFHLGVHESLVRLGEFVGGFLLFGGGVGECFIRGGLGFGGGFELGGEIGDGFVGSDFFGVLGLGGFFGGGLGISLERGDGLVGGFLRVGGFFTAAVASMAGLSAAAFSSMALARAFFCRGEFFEGGFFVGGFLAASCSFLRLSSEVLRTPF